MHRAVVARANGASRPSSKLSRRGRLGAQLLPQALAVRTLVSRALHCMSSASTGLLVALVCCARIASAQNASEPGLPSWNDGPARRAIVHFVHEVTTPGGANFVAPQERVAVFDNDGTLWAEQPLYFQLQFMLAQVVAQAPSHPEWKDNPAFKAIVAKDKQALMALGVKPVLQLLAQANAGMTTAQYDSQIREWLKSARHPRFDRLYTDLVYVPMQELLSYLRDHGFKTFIVSGGSVEFMRPWAESAYGIPPEQIIGTVTGTRLEADNGAPVLRRLAKIEFVDDGPGKPVGIYRGIGRQPIFAFGNSDGDLQMLQWTAAGKGLRFMALVHHTDGEREFAYDRKSKVGKLDKALDEAQARGWTVVDMKSDWSRVFGFQ
jgi:phosphoserine phosphatase